MNKKVKMLTAPYIYEGVVGCFVDCIFGMIVLLLCAIHGIDSQNDLEISLLVSNSMVIIFIITMDAPMMIKCMKDRRNPCIITATGVLEDILPDKNWSYKMKPSSHTTESSCIYYYPKSWLMCRYRLALRTSNGVLIKPRSIHSIAHVQQEISNIVGIQKNLNQQVILKVRYLKYLKVIIDINMENYPCNMKKRTVEYIETMLANITRWTVRSH
jgi:hypothetical protein